MRPRKLALDLDPNRKASLALQIASGLAAAIRRGLFKPEEALPSSRQLAEDLGVNRNTVLNALRELEAEGWVETRVGAGTFVCRTLPDREPAAWAGGARAAGPADQAGFDVPAALAALTPPLDVKLNLEEPLPDPRLAPQDALAKAYQRAIRLHGGDLLGLGEPQGNALLRQSLAEMLGRHHGLTVDPDQVLVTRGSRMALDLVTLALAPDGAAVAVENPGNPIAWETMRQSTQARLLPVPVDAGGLDPGALEALLDREKVAYLYLSPCTQNPTTVALAPERRKRILDLARDRRLPILEDDSEGAYHYEGPVQFPLATQDATGQVIYLGSLSRLIAPGLRLGYLVAPRDLASRLARVRRQMDWQGDRVLEWAVADLWRDGDLDRHLRKARKAYQERRDHLAAALRHHLGKGWRFQAPAGGLSLWVEPPPDVDLGAFWRRCRDLDVRFHPSGRFFLGDPKGRGLRLGFAALTGPELFEAVRRMAAALAQG
jgi:GntR family transcriptional regulator/MocR family aminotransferase